MILLRPAVWAAALLALAAHALVLFAVIPWDETEVDTPTPPLVVMRFEVAEPEPEPEPPEPEPEPPPPEPEPEPPPPEPEPPPPEPEPPPPPPEPEPEPLPEPEPPPPKPEPPPRPEPPPPRPQPLAPPPEPAPPPPPDPAQVASFEQALAAALEREKAYPLMARRRREEGEALLFVRIDRAGQVLEYRIEQGSGHESLDEAVREMVARAALPAMPAELAGDSYEFRVPIRFSLR